MSDSTRPDEGIDQIKEVIANAAEELGFLVASDDELAEFIQAGKELTEQADESAKREGRRFLNEETDGELIETWQREACECKSIADATAFATRLLRDYRHDYGTICHAIACGAAAMANGMNNEPEGGLTGFQAGFVWWGFFKLWMHAGDGPMRMVDYSDLLYPQYEHKFREISRDTWEWAQAKAASFIAEHKSDLVHPDVRAHWQSIVDGAVPFGLSVEVPS